MDKQRAIELLKQKSEEAVYVGSLPYRNNEYIPWRRNIEDILESTFGVKSTEYKRVADVHPITTKGTKAVLQRAYVRLIHRIQLEVNSIIQKYEILGIEPQIATKAEPKEDTTELPVNLFDKMQFHPRVVEASRSCFESELYREAILNAFIVFIDYVKEITGLDLDGDDLINKVFSFEYDKNLRKITKYPIIRINDLKGTNDRSEQQGFMYLCKGAAGYNRNPKAHKLIPQSNPYHTLEQLAFASLLIRRVEEGKFVKPTAKRDKWDWDKFLSNIQGRCDSEITNLAKNLYNFTRSNADSISWGTGTKDGSFTFRKLGVGKLISIFSVYSYGGIYINFSSMKNKNVNDNTIESFKDSLNRIPNIILTKEAVISGYPRIFEKPLTNPENLKLFQDAVIALCQQLDAKGAA